MRTKLLHLISVSTKALAEGTKSTIEAAGNAMADWSEFTIKAKRDVSRELRNERGRWSTAAGVSSAAYDPKKELWVDEKGKPLSKKDQARIASLPAIHKGIIGVRLNPDTEGVTQAIGYSHNPKTGEMGKMKYFLSDAHKVASYKAKFKALGDFSKAKAILEKKSYEDALNGKAAAAAVFIMDRTAIRIGNKGSAAKKKASFGVTTLEARHVKVRNNLVTFKFAAKGAKPYEKTFGDAKLATVIRAFLTTKDGEDKKLGDRLIPCNDDTVRTYMEENGGKSMQKGKIGPHFYRYHWATAKALQELRKHAKPLSKKVASRIKKKACEAAAAFLNNTPGMCYENYICPAVWKDWGEDVRPASPKLSRELKAAGFDYANHLSPAKAQLLIDEMLEDTVFPDSLDTSEFDLDELFPDEEDMMPTGEYDELKD